MKKTFTALLIIFSSVVFAQNFDREKMDAYFSLLEEKDKAMGSVSIFRNDEEIYSKSIGYADVEKKIKANHDTKYRIGSISKSFTAVIIMQLIEEGKLSLQTPLSEFYTSFENAEGITIAHLLRHQSGIYNITNSDDYKKWMEKPINRGDLVEKIIEKGHVFDPGEKTEYSNSNYILLSLIAETIEIDSYENILNQRIVKPLQLKNTYFGGKINTDNNESQSYARIKTWAKSTETDMSIPMGAGSIVSTPNDLNVFYYNLFMGNLVSKESLEEMMRLEDNFGIGLFQSPFYERKAYGHTGGIDAFQSSADYFPADAIFVSYTSNGINIPLNDIMIGILSILFGKDYELPTFQTGMKVEIKQLNKYVGVYSSADMPMDLTISLKDGQLFGQATGQSEFPLEPYEKHKFKFENAGLKIDFDPDKKMLYLHQGGGIFMFYKNKK